MRGPSPQRGVTLVELLITIVLAGIVFAALVPVFVSAAQQTSTDRSRILATNTAQSVIERLRDLPYDELYDTTWSDDAARAAVLGMPSQWKGASSDVSVEVEPYPSGSARGSEKYLVATVTASWHGPGGRPHEVTMKTAIYREGLGTETLVLYVAPLTGGVIRESTVMVTARLGAADAFNTQRVDFTVYANNGTVVASWSVDSIDAEDDRGDGFTYYEQGWVTDGLQDGRYSFVAKTVPVVADPQPPAEWARKEYILDRDPPSNQIIRTCQAGFQVGLNAVLTPFVYLGWSPETGQTDIDRFEISRTGIAADGTTIPPVVVTVPNWSMEYVDRNVVEGATYTYAIRGWDIQDQHGEWSPTPGSTSVPTAPTTVLEPDAPPPSIRYELGDRSVTVIWNPSPTALADHYRVYRKGADGVTLLVATVDSDPVRTDGLFEYTDNAVEYGASYVYYVSSLVLLGAPLQWESLSLSGMPIRVPEPPRVGMRIDVVASSGITVPRLARLVIHNLDNGDLIPANPWDYPSINPTSNNVNQNTWVTGNVLYPGRYEVMGIFYDQNRNPIATYVSEAVELTESDTPIHIPYNGPN